MIITIANRKGGSGKTTCCINIAMAAVLKGYRVMLIDMDPQQTLTNWYERWKGEIPNLSLLTHDFKNSPTYLSQILGEIKKQRTYDYCFIDTAGFDSELSRISLSIADFVIIPCKTVGVDMEGASQTIAYAEKEKKPLLFLISQVIEKTPFEDFLPIFSSFSKRGVLVPSYFYVDNAYAVALSSGKTIFDFSKKSLKEDVNRAWSFIEEYCRETTSAEKGAPLLTLKKPKAVQEKKLHKKQYFSQSQPSQPKKRGRPKKNRGINV
jgi:chromosome partitioning protein